MPYSATRLVEDYGQLPKFKTPSRPLNWLARLYETNNGMISREINDLAVEMSKHSPIVSLIAEGDILPTRKAGKRLIKVVQDFRWAGTPKDYGGKWDDLDYEDFLATSQQMEEENLYTNRPIRSYSRTGTSLGRRVLYMIPSSFHGQLVGIHSNALEVNGSTREFSGYNQFLGEMAVGQAYLIGDDGEGTTGVAEASIVQPRLYT